MRTVTSEELFGGGNAVLIQHAGAWYLLRKMTGGGLKLTRWSGDKPADIEFRTFNCREVR